MAIKRLKAFLIDFFIILAYVGFLYVVTISFYRIFPHLLKKIGPVSEQILGFICLALPVILYFTLMENSKYKATIGKRKFNLQTVSKNLSKANFDQLLLRNFVKFLPWILAHFFVFRWFDFMRNNIPPPIWVSEGLIMSQALAVVYLILLFTNNHRNIYEILSSTIVIERT